MKELLIGAGNARTKELAFKDNKEWGELVTLDIDPDSNPNVCWDLNDLPLPFQNEEFDEIHAYEVLEHIGQQGDWRTFFAQFSEFYRILKKGGHLFATTPPWNSEWAWADPGHTRVISMGTLTFLDRNEYDKQVGKTPMTDYRHVYKGDFEIVHSEVKGDRFAFVLRKR